MARRLQYCTAVSACPTAATCGPHYPAMTVRAAWDVDDPVEGELGGRRMAVSLFFDGILPAGDWEVEQIKLKCATCGREVALIVR
ncbi:MAG: hypothetical protein HYR48_07585 [Gemmatimonadetes bacterium]|nr:hypothetical protein [Gemmatimonadota bacterium]